MRWGKGAALTTGYSGYVDALLRCADACRRCIDAALLRCCVVPTRGQRCIGAALPRCCVVLPCGHRCVVAALHRCRVAIWPADVVTWLRRCCVAALLRCQATSQRCIAAALPRCAVSLRRSMSLSYKQTFVKVAFVAWLRCDVVSYLDARCHVEALLRCCVAPAQWERCVVATLRGCWDAWRDCNHATMLRCYVATLCLGLRYELN